MKPPICSDCGRPFDPSEEGGLVSTGPTPEPWWEGIADPGEVERHGPPTGHPPGVEWFCGEHAEEARRRAERTGGGRTSGGEGPEDGGSRRSSRRWAWVVLALVLIGLVARQWGQRVEREDREESYRLAGEASTAMYLDRLRSSAPPGTAVPAYLETVARTVPGWRSRWRAPPLVHRVSAPLLMGTPTLEVTLADGRVVEVRAAGREPPGEPIPGDSAAVLLGLSPDRPIFAGEVPDTTAGIGR